MMICTFSLGPKEIYAIDAGRVVELIAKPDEITESNLMNIRGEPITLLDPTSYFTFVSTDDGIPPGNEVVLICSYKNGKVGVLANHVYDVFEVQDESIMPDPIDSLVVEGVIDYEDNLVILLDLDCLINKIIS